MLRDESAVCKVKAKVEGQVVSEAEILFVFNPENLDNQESQELLERLERKNLGLLWDGYADWDERVKGDS